MVRVFSVKQKQPTPFINSFPPAFPLRSETPIIAGHWSLWQLNIYSRFRHFSYICLNIGWYGESPTPLQSPGYAVLCSRASLSAIMAMNSPFLSLSANLADAARQPMHIDGLDHVEPGPSFHHTHDEIVPAKGAHHDHLRQ